MVGAADMTATRTRAEANDRLTQALFRLAAKGQRPRCGDYETSWMWLDEDPHNRAHAAAMCSGCPVFDPCDEVGQHQRFGTWAGVDRTRARGKKAA
jgi:hypothetical protein